MPRTIADRLAHALISEGWTELPAKAGYRRFSSPKHGDQLMHVGRAGGLRYGRVASASCSFTDGTFYKRLLAMTAAPSLEEV